MILYSNINYHIFYTFIERQFLDIKLIELFFLNKFMKVINKM